VDFHPAGKITATTLVTVSFAAAARNPTISETCRRHDTSFGDKSIIYKYFYNIRMPRSNESVPVQVRPRENPDD